MRNKYGFYKDTESFVRIFFAYCIKINFNDLAKSQST